MSKLYFRYAAMNAGKSTALLQAAHNYEERGMRVLLFTAAHDDRAGTGVIGSRLGLQRQARPSAPTPSSHANTCRPTSPAC
jgi:thymidine kinase